MIHLLATALVALSNWLTFTASVGATPAATLCRVTGEPATGPTSVTSLLVGVPFAPRPVVGAPAVEYCTGALFCSAATAAPTLFCGLPYTL
ncbi:hypothetical protein R69746_08873 [Paraburkholderia aspalathi]|nr:hypothetical protein R69746_08873 [Paraburkholderia aspalathi]